MVAGSQRRLLWIAWGLMLAVVVGAWALGALDRAERSVDDTRFAVRGDRAPDPRIAIVAIDDVSLSALGSFPFPRDEHTRVLNRLRRAGARVIVYDVVFAEHGPDPDQDDRLIAALQRNGNVLLAAAESDGHGRPNVLGGEPERFGARAGSANFAPDADGRIRRLQAQAGDLPTLPVAAARRAGVDVDLSRLGGEGAPIDFAGPDGTYPVYSFSAVRDGRVPAARLRGKYVIVGATDPNLQDVHPTPTSSAMSGPEIQANALATLLDGLPLRQAPGLVTVLLMAALAAVGPLVALRRGPWATVAAAVGAGLAFAVLDELAFVGPGWMIDVVSPLAAIMATLPFVLLIGVLSARVEIAEARIFAFEAADEARRGVERDLHDGAQQRLITLALDLSARGDKDGAAEVRAAVDELRALARGVYPPALVEGGLDAGLEQLVEQLPAHVRVEGRIGRRLSRPVEAVAYFVVSEAVANALKHADARRIDISVSADERQVHVEVRDDGRGGADASGSGLSSLRDRVTAHRGRLTIGPGDGGGTAVRADLPL